MVDLSQLRGRQAGAAQPLVDMEVEEAKLSLGDSAEGVGVDPNKLDQRRFRQSTVQRRSKRTERVHVIIVQRIAARAEAGGLPEAADQRDVGTGLLGRFLEGVHGEAARGELLVREIRKEAFLLARGPLDRLETEAPVQEKPD